MTGSRSSMFSSTRRAPRRGGLRALGIVVAILVGLALLWVTVVGGLWLYAWFRLGGIDLAALDEDIAPLGVSGAGAPVDATTVLIAMTGPVDPTVPEPPGLDGPLVLLQFGGPRSQPAALVVSNQLAVALDAEGETSFADVQLAGGQELLVRAVTDYTEVRIDHVVSVSSDALPRVIEIMEDLEVCDTGGCRRPTSEELQVGLEQSNDTDYVRAVAATVRAAAARADLPWVARSPLRAKRLVDVVADEVETDVSLRGTGLLAVADALAGADELDIDEVPFVVNPSTDRIVPLEEPAAIRFQHLREGTPFTADEEVEAEEPVVSDVSVAVLNGAGVDGLAGRVQLELETAGYRVIGVGNAPAFDRTTTVVHYAEGDPSVEYVAVLVAEQLGGVSLEPLTRVPTFEGAEVDVLVTAGEDLDDETPD